MSLRYLFQLDRYFPSKALLYDLLRAFCDVGGKVANSFQIGRNAQSTDNFAEIDRQWLACCNGLNCLGLDAAGL